MSHARSRLTVFGRALLVQRVIEEGWTAAAAAEAAGVSRATVYKWWRRFEAEGHAGLADRSSRPLSSPTRTPWSLERRILKLRVTKKLGPHRIGYRLGLPQSSCYAVLRRRRLNRLDWIDRPSGEVIRRYERSVAGELVHVDVKKLARIPAGGGHRLLGRDAGPHHTGGGYEYVHSAVDDFSRLAYSEIHADERADTSVAFLRRATSFFSSHGLTVQELLTDNAKVYRYSHAFRAAITELGITQLFTKPRRPQTNGKVERYNRTFLDEWAYVRLYTSNQERSASLGAWLERYNHHRSHTALGGLPPIARVNNVCGNYS